VRRSDQRRAAVVALYQQDVTGRPMDDVLPRDATLFTKELVEGVEVEREELDMLIERHAEGWTLDRIAPLERNILRVALHELIHRSDIPDEVAIDEAVETAKELCSAETPRFVNGILGAVQRQEAAKR
jgi:N utilization substance protein B